MNGFEILRGWTTRASNLIETPSNNGNFLKLTRPFGAAEDYLTRTLTPEALSLLDQLFDNDRGKLLINKLSSFKATAVGDESKFRKIIVGLIFEETAAPFVREKYLDYLYSQDQNPSRSKIHIVTSITLDKIFKTLNKVNGQDRSYYDLCTAYLGVTLPDYLILQETEDRLVVEAVAECKTSSNGNSDIERQLTHYPIPSMIASNFHISLCPDGTNLGRVYKLGELLNQHLPDIPPLPVNFRRHLDYFLVVPRESKLTYPPRFEKIETPFNSTEYAMFLEAISKGCSKQ